MDVSCMSLDDIINEKKPKKKRNEQRNFEDGRPAAARAGNGQRAAGPGAKVLPPRKSPKQIRDARDIICLKARERIVDARDTLNKKMRRCDARERLRHRKREGKARGIEPLDVGTRANNRPSTTPPPINRAARANKSFYGRPLTSYMDIEDSYELCESSPERFYIPPKRKPPAQRVSPPQPLLQRTVRNDVFSLPTTMPPPPEFRTVRKVTETPLMAPLSVADLPWSDPFQTYERLRRPHMHAPLAPLPVAALIPYEPTSSTARHPRSILRNRSRSPTAMGDAVEHPQLSSSMRARLERAPNPSESMGIFAKLPDTYSRKYIPSSYNKPASPKTLASAISSVVYRGPSAAPPSPPTTGYRIVVSNLHNKVVYQDIEELFSDIGELMEARLVRPGVAEVIYRTLKDAENAVDAYHNRQLDGQPMNCLLVHPRASNKPTAPALSSVKFGSR